MDAEPEELTDDQIRALRDQLCAQRDRLVAAMEAGAEGTKPVDLGEPIGRISRIDALAQREMNEAGQRAQKQQLVDVRRALEAMDADEYGLCRVCDSPIGFRRLEARPFSRLCVACQSAQERR